ncbi:MAG: Fe-S oxidoreductase [Candidatus Helarchaeota archaeon]
MNILLVEPTFPKVSKSKNHRDFLPIGLLKLAAYHRKKKNAICLIRGELNKEEIFFEYPNGIISKNTIPDMILITSYFTYWAKYVRDSVRHYRKLYPNAKIIVGGIYASLMPNHCKKYTGCDEVYIGIHEEAEKTPISYSYLEKHFGSVDYQIIHTTRGCIRRCEYCGVYRIEPEFTYKDTIKKEIFKKKIIFYDNNLIANPKIENILIELSELKSKGRIISCEAQSGIDGRILEKRPELALLLKDAGFKNIRISWDGHYSDFPHIKKQLNILKAAGYNLQEDVFIFMIYNWEIPYEEMEKKRIKCWEWKVQICDCRYRPLDKWYDKYNPQKFKMGQTDRDYYIHKVAGWTDKKVRNFRKHIRRQNICIRFKISFYTDAIERNYLRKFVKLRLIEVARKNMIDNLIDFLNRMKIPYWFPENFDGNGQYITKFDIYNEFEQLTGKSAILKGKESYNFKKWREFCQNQAFKKFL